jgi:hypothetical protein
MKKLALLLFIVLAAAGLWWWESPRLATENLLDAAHDRDVAELETLIDADALRASLRKLPAAAPTQAAVAPATPRVPADPLLAGLSRDADLVALDLATRTAWEIDREGLNTFRVLRKTGEGDALPTLLFARDGLHWKLVGVERGSLASSSEAIGRQE